MNLVLDCREKALYEACLNVIKNELCFQRKIQLCSRNLELGDIIIENQEGIPIVYIERKSISDLVASIKDGRYREQSVRLGSLEIENHNIIYLIEGSITSKFSKEKQMIFSSMFSINYFKGFSLMRSNNIEETAYIVCNMYLKLLKTKCKKGYYKNKPKVHIVMDDDDKTEAVELVEVTPPPSYSSLIKTKKNANITTSNFGEIVLCNIPSISSTTAIPIMKHFKTINNLVLELSKNKSILDNFTYETSKGQTRKLTKPVIKNIIDYLLQEEV